MNTRSQTKYNTRTLYEVDIDFDEASRMWEYNKKRTGFGSYKYICCELNKSGIKCGRHIVDDTKYCRTHNKKLLISSLN